MKGFRHDSSPSIAAVGEKKDAGICELKCRMPFFLSRRANGLFFNIFEKYQNIQGEWQSFKFQAKVWIVIQCYIVIQ